jgi:ornithine cyclodeaminase/alanine dehydrogenase-like protein (mu-crystallin family)
MLVLTRGEIEALLDPEALVEAVAAGFRALSSGDVAAPPRQAVETERGAVLAMPGRQAGGPVVVKLVGVFPGNAELGLEPHPALICVLDADTGVALALMDGDHVTAMRTAAGSALSIRLAAREDARVLSVVGAGVQARAHLRLLAPCFAQVRVTARDGAAARRLAAEFGASVTDRPADGADVVCLTTGAGSPVLLAADVAPGTHVTSVGFAPPGGELDPALARRARLLVETRGAFAPPPAGCAELAGLDPAAAFELGELLLGRAPGRTAADEITVYKAMGHVAEDAAAAELAYRLARAAGAGREVAL